MKGGGGARIFAPCTSPPNFPLTFKRCLLGWLQPSCGQMPTSLLTNCSGRIPRENGGPSLKPLHPVLPKQGSTGQGHAESWKLSPLKDSQAALNKRGEWEKKNFFFSIKSLSSLLRGTLGTLKRSPTALQTSRRVMQALRTEHQSGHTRT